MAEACVPQRNKQESHEKAASFTVRPETSLESFMAVGRFVPVYRKF